MLNLAGSEFDFAQVVYTVLDECEHRRRSVPPDSRGEEFAQIGRRKLAEIKGAYEEVGGSASYWEALQREVLETAIPQYAPAALQMNALERSGFRLLRQGDPASRGIYALGGLLIGSAIIATPFIPFVENTFALLLTATGFFYPDIVRFTADRKHARMLNGLVEAAANFQQNARVVYLSNKDLDDSFGPGNQPKRLEAGDSPLRSE